MLILRVFMVFDLVKSYYIDAAKSTLCVNTDI